MFFLCSLIFICFTPYLGCGSDPILDKAAEIKKESTSSKTASESLKPGIPAEPKPVQVQPKPVQPKEPVEPKKDEKPHVVVSGFVQITGEGDWDGKPIRIDVFDGDQRALGGPRPKVVLTSRIAE
jgi:hypothetical protein